MEGVLGAGDIALASGYLDKHEPSQTTPGFEAIRSRAAARRMDVPAPIRHANLAISLDPTSDSALGNQLADYFLAGNRVDATALPPQIATPPRADVHPDIG